MSRFLVLLSFWLVPLYSLSNDMNHTDWTALYKKNFSQAICKTNTYKKTLLFMRDNIAPFTQLLFSWNALRPEKDHFSFYVQVRNSATKKWGTWHHMADWGKNIQQSYMSKSDGFSSYIHVRLEVDNKKHADAFRIKVESHNSASLALVHSVSVAVSNFTVFKAESHTNIDASLQSVHITGVPAIAQLALDHEDKARICSPISCSMLAYYVNGTHKNPLEFVAGVFDSGLGIYGSWPCNMAHAFEHCHGKANFFVRRMNSFADMHQQLLHDIPVVVSVRGNLPGALKPFPHGHLMVVVGWDSISREVLCHDPASDTHEMVFKRYPIEHFLRAWECSHRLAYVAEPIHIVAKKQPPA